MPGGRGEDKRNVFAEEMIAMRGQRGWTQEETAAKMLVSTSTIANIESGYRPPTPAQALKADEVFGTPGTFQRHERRMRGIPFSAGFRPFHPYEAEARVLRMFQHTLVPGLFQVEGYARAILETHPEVTEQDVKDRVDARIGRMEQPPAIVYLENASEGQTAEDPDMAESMTLMFDALRTEALTGSASLKLIEEAIQRWKERTQT
jgi:transcriptional regulator with XRE-family HTH domain